MKVERALPGNIWSIKLRDSHRDYDDDGDYDDDDGNNVINKDSNCTASHCHSSHSPFFSPLLFNAVNFNLPVLLAFSHPGPVPMQSVKSCL